MSTPFKKALVHLLTKPYDEKALFQELITLDHETFTIDEFLKLQELSGQKAKAELCTTVANKLVDPTVVVTLAMAARRTPGLHELSNCIATDIVEICLQDESETERTRVRQALQEKLPDAASLFAQRKTDSVEPESKDKGPQKILRQVMATLRVTCNVKNTFGIVRTMKKLKDAETSRKVHFHFECSVPQNLLDVLLKDEVDISFEKLCDQLESSGDADAMFVLAQAARCQGNEDVSQTLLGEVANALGNSHPDQLPQVKHIHEKLVDINNQPVESLRQLNAAAGCIEPLKCPTLPPRAPKYHPRSVSEQQVRNAIKAVSLNPQNGPFLLFGGGGTGKSSVAAQVISSESGTGFFQQQCRVQVILYVNCYRWNNGIYDPKEMENELFSMAKSCYDQKSTNLATFVELLEYLEKRDNKRILVVLDDCFHENVLLIFQQKYSQCPCFAITRYYQDLENIQFSGHHLITPMADSQILEMLAETFGLGGKGKLSLFQLEILSQLCCGSPLVAQLVAGYFPKRNCNYEERFGELTNSDFGQLGKAPIPNNVYKPDEKQASILFQRAMERLTKTQRQFFFAVLLFDPVEPIRVAQMGRLWNEKPENAEIIVNALEEIAVIHKTTEPGVPHGRVKNGAMISVHQIVHECAADYAKRLFGVTCLSKLRMKIMGSAVSKLLEQTNQLQLDEINCLIRLLCNCREWGLAKYVQRHFEPTYFENYGEYLILPREENSCPTDGALLCAEHNFPSLVPLVHQYDCKAIYKKDGSADTALHNAAALGFLEVTKQLLKISPEAATIENSHGNTPLHLAVIAHKGHVAKYLAGRNPAAIKQKNHEGNTVLHEAIQNRFLNDCELLGLVEVLCSECPDVLGMQNDDGYTPLHLAVKSEYQMSDYGYLRGTFDHNVVIFLAEQNPDTVKQKDHQGNTVLHEAARNSWTVLQVVEVLYNKWPGAAEMLNENGDTPLHIAVKRKKDSVTVFRRLGKFDDGVANFLAEKSPVAVKQKDRKGNTALHFAVRNQILKDYKLLELVEALCNACPDVLGMQNDDGDTPLDLSKRPLVSQFLSRRTSEINEQSTQAAKQQNRFLKACDLRTPGTGRDFVQGMPTDEYTKK